MEKMLAGIKKRCNFAAVNKTTQVGPVVQFG